MVCPVHPRSCGEQRLLIFLPVVFTGSSPLVRGTVTLLLLTLLAVRFIPARAGNSHRYLVQLIYPPVHPRSCGEQVRP